MALYDHGGLASQVPKPIAEGGTGANNANDAINNLLPSQTGNGGKFLKTDGTDTSWAAAGGGSGSVDSVTGLNTDNTDPTNPIVRISVDGTTITGQGTPGDPLVAVTGGGGTVTDVTVVTDNGFAGTVANSTTTPAITIETTVTGLVKGDGTAISAAEAGTDYTNTAFKTISVSGQDDVVADTASDTLTLIAGTNVTISTDGTNDSITFNASSNASTVTISNESTDATCFPLFSTAATGDLQPKTNAGLTFNAATVNLGCTTFTGALVGNASTATALQTPRTIGGTSFDGTANIVPSLITIANESTDTSCFVNFSTAATGDLQPKTSPSLTYNAGSGALASTSFVGSFSGNASTATALATGRTISITGDLAYTSPSFDGTTNISAAGTLATVNSNVGSFTYSSITVNAKGLVTAASSGATPATAAFTTISVSGQDNVVADSPTDTLTLAAGSNITITTNATTDTITFAAAGGGNVSNTGTPVDNQIAVWTDATTIEGTSGLTYDGSNLQLTGDIGSTGTRITKGWFTDLTVTNAIAGSVTGNAGTVTVADAAGDTTTFVLLATDATGSLSPRTDAGITYNATTNALTATTFIGSLTGNADTATTATNITVANEATDTTCFITFTTDAAGNLPPKSSASLTYNAATGALGATSVTATTFISTASDVADSGVIRLGNAELIAWEATTAGTDLTLGMDANNVLSSSTPINATTGYRIGNAAASGVVLRGNGTNYVASTFTIPDTYAQGDIIYASATSVFSALTKDANATRYLSNQGSSNSPSWNQVNLANGVTGDLPFANITQIAGLSVLGVTGSSTADVAAITGTANQILRVNGAASALAFGSIDLAQSAAIGSSILPVVNGGTGQSSYTNGQLLIGNTTGNTLAKGSLTMSGNGIGITGGAGTITFDLRDDLLALEAIGTTGLATRTATNTWTTRTLTGGGGITVTNGDGVSGNPTLSISNLKTLWIPANAMRPSVTGGSAPLSLVATAANQPDVSSLNFDPTTQEYAQFAVRFPKGWNEGTITAAFYWSHAATTTNFGVRWGIQAVAVSNDDTIAVAYGTAQEVTDTGGTTNDLYISDVISAMTIAGTPAVGDEVFFRVYRDPANAGDNMAIDARLMGVTVFYTIDTMDDT